ncbi:MAG TPA: glycosyltransferase [Candidatus Nanoarchaeia archaeon]|nr:glycosyltransferase [Candidatus Nanoarchaeia archaeon]
MGFHEWVVYPSIYLGLIAISFYILTYTTARKEKKPLFRDEELPFATVVIPAFNEDKSIERTLDSILSSDYPGGFEVIVVDDGSSDNTYDKAKKYEKNNVRVFKKENGGKATALNFGISKARGDFIFSMDADSFVEKYTMKKMMRYFKEPRVMSVTPGMIIYNPKTIWQKVQHLEYLMGIFLRKVFAFLDAIYIAPGAFSVYRKKFFEKHGGYDEGNVVEDLELALRIQYYGYRTENCPDAKVSTIGPAKFKPLLKQRRRWYYGLLKNFWNYRKMVSRKYGDLGLFVMPIGWITIFFSMIAFVYGFIKMTSTIISELAFLSSINYDFASFFDFSAFFFKKIFLTVVTEPLVLFMGVSVVLLAFYIKYANTKIGRINSVFSSLFLFFILFIPLFAFWWFISFFYFLLSKTPKWR